MSALEQAIAGRPGWRMLPNGKARYDAPSGKVALMRWVADDRPDAERQGSWEWDLYPNADSGQVIANDGASDSYLSESLAWCEKWADKP